MRNSGDIELLRFDDVDAADADVVGELRGVAVDGAHQLRFALGRIREPRPLFLGDRVDVRVAGFLTYLFDEFLSFIPPGVGLSFSVLPCRLFLARTRAIAFAVMRTNDELEPDILTLPDGTQEFYKIR